MDDLRRGAIGPEQHVRRRNRSESFPKSGRPKEGVGTIAARRLAVSCIAVWFAAACSSGGPTASGSPAALSQRFADGGSCPVASAPALPTNSGCVTSAQAELDGDGRPDRFVVFARLHGRQPASC